MKSKEVVERINNISKKGLEDELEKSSSRYHLLAAWVAIIFNPIFVITDYLNIPGRWKEFLFIRLGISVITLVTLALGFKNKWPSFLIVIIPFTLISLQNAFGYRIIDNKDVFGHSINYIALLIGGSIFMLWRLKYSILVISISIVATVLCLLSNPKIDFSAFIVQGGLLLMVVALFMIISINTRYSLTSKEIKARLALTVSNEEIKIQAEEIKATNENLELLVTLRTQDLERKNKALEEYAWINAHKLRSPVASILGLMNILKREEINPNARVIMNHLQASTEKLDEVVSSITDAIENAERFETKLY